MPARPALPVTPPRESALIRLAASWGAPVLDAYELYRAADEAFRLQGSPAAEDAARAQAAALEINRRAKNGGALEIGAVGLAFFHGIGQAIHPPAVQSRVAGVWRQGAGIRYRVNYVGSVGSSWTDAKGLHAFVPYGGPNNAPGSYPELYGRELGTFMSGQRIRYEVELENLSSERLTGVRVWSTQEEFMPEGGRGRATEIRGSATAESVHGGAYGPTRVPALAAGERLAFDREFRAGSGSARVSLEQTHLLITTRDAAGNEKILANDPQAGIVDPFER
jgi:hypothetical protein